jgi:DNA-binding response OmpR family regulator
MAVDVAYDGLSAAAKLAVNRYDVVVLDRDLPGLHGDVLCRMIADSADPAMVLMLTASAAPEERVSGLSLARRKPTAQSRILRAGDLELDPLRRVVTRDGVERALSAKEFSVLEALMRAAPAPLSAESLLAQAWDENADPFTKTVQVTIVRLRRKLGDPDAIDTVRGVGYRIVGTEPEPGG